MGLGFLLIVWVALRTMKRSRIDARGGWANRPKLTPEQRKKKAQRENEHGQKMRWTLDDESRPKPD